MSKRGAAEAGLSDASNFRYSQPPSKVLHVRNLPWDCSADDLKELCSPFGQIIQYKMNVGTNKNQAFIEFPEVKAAMNMINYFGTGSEPAQVRGKTVYLQYSTRSEIVHSDKPESQEGNVLLVSVDDIGEAVITIDILHLVFATFGDVHKIATFEKSAGFQALVQYDQHETAEQARSALDGRSIPAYLLPEGAGTCVLRISYSAHTDLNVKFQSYRSRDYKNPDLPIAPSATADGAVQFLEQGPTGGPVRRDAESNVLLCNVENDVYPINVDTLNTVFSPYGTVQKIAIFEKNNGVQALVQYPDMHSAATAKQALEGHAIYDGGYCTLKLTYSRHTDLNVKVNNQRSWDYTRPNYPPAALPPGPQALQATWAVPLLDQDGTHPGVLLAEDLQVLTVEEAHLQGLQEVPHMAPLVDSGVLGVHPGRLAPLALQARELAEKEEGLLAPLVAHLMAHLVDHLADHLVAHRGLQGGLRVGLLEAQQGDHLGHLAAPLAAPLGHLGHLEGKVGRGEAKADGTEYRLKQYCQTILTAV
ncbi:hypothetical protein CYMTET_56405 [Cymbomonas tetramitiformis]|uniref:RRM domain-containing protein n=1 Tax=Cymbomonas tetramitiformis TaxID=36881 RepID=A0AAE0ELV2_9CHLO|nr:hypothetical protein CYMTET_56405 [Cymbomonas tetramitiformis]